MNNIDDCIISILCDNCGFCCILVVYNSIGCLNKILPRELMLMFLNTLSQVSLFYPNTLCKIIHKILITYTQGGYCAVAQFRRLWNRIAFLYVFVCVFSYFFPNLVFLVVFISRPFFVVVISG